MKKLLRKWLGIEEEVTAIDQALAAVRGKITAVQNEGYNMHVQCRGEIESLQKTVDEQREDLEMKINQVSPAIWRLVKDKFVRKENEQ